MATDNAELISKFITYLRAERGVSENTVESYNIDLTKFAEWLSGPLTQAKRTDLSVTSVICSPQARRGELPPAILHRCGPSTGFW